MQFLLNYLLTLIDIQNFSIVNEFFNIAQKNSIDFDEIIKIAKKDYPRLKNMPSKGFVEVHV